MKYLIVILFLIACTKEPIYDLAYRIDSIEHKDTTDIINYSFISNKNGYISYYITFNKGTNDANVFQLKDHLLKGITHCKYYYKKINTAELCFIDFR